MPTPAILRTSPAEDDAHLESAGAEFAGALIYQVRPGWETPASMVLFLRVMEQPTCTRLGWCESIERDLILSQWDGDEGNDVSLRPGEYIVTLFADGDHPISATFSFDGLPGETNLIAVARSDRMHAIRLNDEVVQPTAIPGFEGGRSVAGETWTLPAPGIVIALSWYRAQVYHRGLWGVCIGVPNSKPFDGAGRCEEPNPRRTGEGFGALTAWSMAGICWTAFDEPGCQPGPVRVGYTLELESLSQASGGIGFWLGFGNGDLPGV